ncbi:hypothetical protein L7F22_010431 [Adiantum nelumboides]|nr:hypothetical protein [Adiantum nelumboides]
MDWVRTSGTPLAILLLDFEKAYDRVDWGFLDGSLDMMSFPLAWIRGISALYMSASSSVTIGGHRRCQISLEHSSQPALRGLLMLVADKPELIDQEYADDTLLFLHYSPDVLDAIQYALEVFCVASGARINWDKSYGILAGSDDVLTWGPDDFTWVRPGQTYRYLGFQGGLGIIDPKMQSRALLTKLIVKGFFPGNEPWKMLLQSGLATVTPTYGVRDGHVWTTGMRFMFSDAPVRSRYISHGDCFDVGDVWARAVAKVFLNAILDMVKADTGVLNTPSVRARFSPLDSVSDVWTEDRVVYQLMFAIEALLESIRVTVQDLEELCEQSEDCMGRLDWLQDQSCWYLPFTFLLRPDWPHSPSRVMWSIRDAAAIFGTQEDCLRTWAQEMVSGICAEDFNTLEVITSAEFHPTHCNILAYSSSKGTIRLVDMRQSALCDRHTKLFEEQEVPRSFFTEIIASISDLKFARDGRYMVSRDYMTVKLWDVNMGSAPVATVKVHEYLRPKLCDLYENDSIFDKFECCLSGDGSRAATGSYSNLFRVFGTGVGSEEATTLEASRTPNRRPVQSMPSNAGRSVINFARRAGGRGNEMDSNSGYSFSAKLLHLAWHPSANLIACAASNSLYMYYA